MSLAVWLALLMAAILIAVSPGPGAVSAMSTGARAGYGAALRLIAGLQAALLVQLAIVALGFGALLAASSLAFDLMRYAGAAYLVWIGIQKWRTPPEPPAALAATGARALFRQGLFVNLSNPKAIVFMAALVPQFIDPAAPQAIQYAIIAGTLCTVDTIVMSAYALTAARLNRWLRDARAQRAQNRFFGGLFVAAGGLLAATPRSP